MVRMFAEVIAPSEPRVRHLVGVPDAADRRELPRPTLVVIEEELEGFYLIRLADDGAFCGETWHETDEEARAQTEFEFERVGPWRAGRSLA